MNPLQEYQRWLNHGHHAADIAAELAAIANKPDEIEARFAGDLDFGTGGLRGILGAGTLRMNIHTIRKAARGLADFTTAKRGDTVVIGYDCRRMSREFAIEAALTMVAAGIRAYVFEHLCPTPELSYAVRKLGATVGVMVTASHNPPEYNGFKVYAADGGQVLPKVASGIRTAMQAIENVFEIPVADLDDAQRAGQFRWVGEEMEVDYVREVVREVGNGDLRDAQRASVRLVYTPLHGTGNRPVRAALAEAGYADVFVVASQELPDGEFPTVASPNPEEPAALAAAIQLAAELTADVVFGTDPDADRVGIAARTAHGDYQLFTGNQLGALLLDYILRRHAQNGTLPNNGIVYQTIVTSQFGKAVAQSYGVDVEETLTGFKYIGARITADEMSRTRTFLFGYEESYGYLLSPMVRDKDAVQTCLAVADMAAYYKHLGIDLATALDALQQRVGYFRERLLSVNLTGVDGMARAGRIRADLQRDPLRIPEFSLVAVEDYEARVQTCFDAASRIVKQTGLTLPQSDVLKFRFADGSWVAVRPSGTEPKLKAYIAAEGPDADTCIAKLTQLTNAVTTRLK